MIRLVSVLTVMLLSACGSSSPKPEAEVTSGLASQEEALSQWLDEYPADTAFTLLLASASGARYQHSSGESTVDTLYESASTSKLVTATVIMVLVEDGTLSLSDHPQDYISAWPATGNLAAITLQQLLNFTSGLSEAPLCQNNGLADFTNCVLAIADDNDSSVTPGSEYYYASTHLQVAGLMALNAAINAGSLDEGSDWNDLFAAFKTRFGLFSHSTYDLPSASNPRLAGGMHWSGNDYMAFLQALYQGDIVSATALSSMRTDYLGSATITYSPAAEVGASWHYGDGLWLESCDGSQSDCISQRISSPGAYGAYPFIDFELGYWGLLARQGSLGTFADGYELMTSARTMLDNWAALAADGD